MDAPRKPRKAAKVSLAPHGDLIAEMMKAGATFTDVAARLQSERGVTASTAELHGFWHRKRREQFDQEIELALMDKPNLGNLVRAVRVMLARYCSRDTINAEDLKAIGTVLRPLIEWEGFRRQTCEMFVEFAKDDAMRGLALSDCDRNEKIKRLHLAIFGEEVAA